MTETLAMSRRPALAALLLAFGQFTLIADAGAVPMRLFGYDVDVRKTIVGGDPVGVPPDSPALRIDANTTTSAFIGVGSLQISFGGAGTYICSGAAISPIHVLTAGHCLDIDDNGGIDAAPSAVTFNLNYGSNLSHQVTASALDIHPEYTGFANPSVNDDIAVVTLSSALPGEVVYDILRAPLAGGSTLTMVGYGRSGDGVSGFTTGASFTVKRAGANNYDAFLPEDDLLPPQVEVFGFDFDHVGATDLFGGVTLANDVEATLGGGDSGGPSFLDVNGELVIAGVNTFLFDGVNPEGGSVPLPLFGSGGGGILVPAYADWLDDNFLSTVVPIPGSGLLLVSAIGLAGLAARRRRTV